MAVKVLLWRVEFYTLEKAMTRFPQFWAVSRALVVILATWGIVSYDASKTNVDWIASLLISISTGLFLSFWFLANRNRPHIDWSKPFSVTEPFFPMNQFPLRYCLVLATSFILGGGVSVIREVLRDGHQLAFRATFIFLGIAILFAAAPWMRKR